MDALTLGLMIWGTAIVNRRVRERREQNERAHIIRITHVEPRNVDTDA